MTRIEPGTEADEAAIRAALAAHNAAQGWPQDPQPLRLLLRGDDGVVRGGLMGQVNWRWLYIQTLAVPEELRGRGWGRRLMAAAEAEARARGCAGIRLDTYDFQARGFYQRLGYLETGRIENCPPGHVRFSMAKHLEPAEASAEPWPDAAAPRAMIALSAAEGGPALQAVLAGLRVHNQEAAGPDGHEPVTISVRRPGEAMPAGGLVGYVLYRWFFVRLFHLPPDLRRGGLGSALLARAEAAARARGCVGIWLDTFSFQARPFYEKQGFRVFATLPDFPPGHARHFLMKRLDAAQGES